MVRGKLLKTNVNGTFISCEVDSTLKFDGDMLPASSVTSGQWKEFIRGKKGWTVVVNGKLTTTNLRDLYNAFLNNTEITLQFKTVDNSLVWQGKAYVQVGDINSPRTGVAGWNITFQGQGPLTLLP